MGQENMPEDIRQRGCVGRVVPLLCRCLCQLRGPAGSEPRQYGKLEPSGGDPVRNPLAREPTHQLEIVSSCNHELDTQEDAKSPLYAPEVADDNALSRPTEAMPQALLKPPPTGATADGNDETEPEGDYVIGGYHPVSVGDVYDSRYEVLHKLGWGVYSTVWCCWDVVERRRVALKVQKAAPEYAAAAANEITILRHVQRAAEARGITPHVVLLLAHFSVAGPHGTHTCMVFELLGETLLHALRSRGAFEAGEVQTITRRLLESLAFLHDDVGALHTDVKPENVLLAPPGSGDAVTLVDLGTAFYAAEQTAAAIQTREYRCPEGILGVRPFGPAADVWSAGCLIFELLTGETLFDPQSPCAGEGFSKDESHLAQAVELLGPVPPSLTVRGARVSDWFAADASTLTNVAVLPPSPGADALALVLEENFDVLRDDARAASEFLRTLLAFDPKNRISARAALDLPWLAHS